MRRVKVQLIKEGLSPKVKKRLTELQALHSVNPQFAHPTKARLGGDFGPKRIATYDRVKGEARIHKLCDDVPIGEIERKIVKEQEKIDRSLRLSNPNALNPDGTFKKGVRLEKTKTCVKRILRVKSLYRTLRVRRKESHEKRANYMLASGLIFVTEDHSIGAWGRRTKELRKNSNGKYKRRKRFGTSLLRYAPALLRSIVKRKMIGFGQKMVEVNTLMARASQYDPFTKTYTKHALSVRAFMINGHWVHRDLWSAYLLAYIIDPELGKYDDLALMRDFPIFLAAQDKALKEAGIDLNTLSI